MVTHCCIDVDKRDVSEVRIGERIKTLVPTLDSSVEILLMAFLKVFPFLLDQQTQILLFAFEFRLVDVLEIVSSLHHADKDETLVALKNRVFVAEVFD